MAGERILPRGSSQFLCYFSMCLYCFWTSKLAPSYRPTVQDAKAHQEERKKAADNPVGANHPYAVYSAHAFRMRTKEQRTIVPQEVMEAHTRSGMRAVVASKTRKRR